MLFKNNYHDPFLKEVALHDMALDNWSNAIVERQVAAITQAPGHCCGANFLGNLYGKYWEKKENVEAALSFLKTEFREHRIPAKRNEEGDPIQQFTSWIIHGIYFYLSDETRHFDHHLKKYPGVQKVHSFRNYSNGHPGRMVDLYFLSFVE